jgi:hypothetical protein
MKRRAAFSCPRNGEVVFGEPADDWAPALVEHGHIEENQGRRDPKSRHTGRWLLTLRRQFLSGDEK